MAIPLTEEQQRAIDSAVDTPPQVVDPRTRASYVLVPVEDYEAVREALLDEKQQKAIRTVALRNAAGRAREHSQPDQPIPGVSITESNQWISPFTIRQNSSSFS